MSANALIFLVGLLVTIVTIGAVILVGRMEEQDDRNRP
jgi:hypothetical protein